MLKIKTSFVLKQGVSVNFKNLPTLAKAKTLADGSTETADDHKARIYTALQDIASFYSNGVEVFPEYEIDLDNYAIVYDSVEFDKLRVDPTNGGTEDGYQVASNLYDLDYQIFDSSTDVPYEVCSQIPTDVALTVYDENATYLEPSLSMSTTSVSNKTDDGFETVYIANDLDDYVPFESLYSNIDSPSKVQYYTVRFTISNIYVGNMSGDVKKYNVNVNYVDTQTAETYRLLSFTFKGGASFAEASDVELANISSKFKTNEGTGYDSFIPELELVDVSSNGYEYVLRIPTYYNYQYPNNDDVINAYYTQIFRGADGISFEMNNYDKNTDSTVQSTLRTAESADSANSSEDDGTSEIIDSLDVLQTKSIMTAVPSTALKGDEMSADSQYFEEQNEFYTYNEHRLSMSGFKINIDGTGVSSAVAKVYSLVGNSAVSQKA